MEHITTGFDKRKTKFPELGSGSGGKGTKRLRKEGEGGDKKVAMVIAMFIEGGEFNVKMACVWWGVRNSGLDDGAGRGRQNFTGPESLRPE